MSKLDARVKNEKSEPFKGNYTLETPERELLFDKHRGEAWPKEYREYRDNWVKYPSEKYVADYPLCVDLELSTVCNLKCPMCYTILDEFKEKVPTKFMDFELFKKIIDEIAGKVPSIRLSFRGESTLHPNFIEAIKYAKSKGIGEVSSLTNGSKLTEEFFTELMLAGLDWLIISVDGMGETYENIRKPLKFDDTYNKIKMTKEVKEKHGYNRPVVKIQSIWPAIEKDPESFYNTFKPITDLISFNPLVDTSRPVHERECVKDFICSSLYQRVFVCSNGEVVACCQDYNSEAIVGDAAKESIYDIWHGEKLNSLRKVLDQPDGFKKISLCSKCVMPSILKQIGTVKINGRDVAYYEYS